LRAAAHHRRAGDARPGRGGLPRRPHRALARGPRGAAGRLRRADRAAGRRVRHALHQRPAPAARAVAGGAMRPHHLLVALALLAAGCGRADFVVGSKAFPESIILGEMVSLLVADAGVSADHRRSLGDTSKTWNGLLAGELDAYVEYTGTLTQEVLADEKIRTE